MDIVMPRLTDSMEEGTVLAWLKQDGDKIAIGDELVEIETDKASMVYESDLAGTLKILVPEGETKPVGEAIATVGSDTGPAAGDEAEGPDARSNGTSTQPDTVKSTEPEIAPVLEVPDAGADTRVKASPLARRIAEDEGIDLATVHGTGPGGRIIKSDVEHAEAGPGPRTTAAATPAPIAPSGDAESTSPAPPAKGIESKKGEVEYVELNRLQTTISRRMSESKATAPHFYLSTEVNMSRAVEVRAAFKASAAGGEAVPSFNDMVVKATALALRNHPHANGAYKDGQIELYSRINVGIAVAAENSLVVPTIGDADHKELREIAAESRQLAERVRNGEITPPELAGGTFSVSNLGMFGVRSFDAVINSGQAGILSVGEIAERPLVEDGKIVAAHLMDINLSCDHRILYGAEGAKFLAEIKSNLEEPGLLA